MALKGSVKLVQDYTERRNLTLWDGTKKKLLIPTRRYEWHCDNTGGETTHEGDYGTGGFELCDYGREIGLTKATGVWFEVYRDFTNDWVDI